MINIKTNMLANVLLYCLDVSKKDINNKIIKSSIAYLKSTKRFERPLIDQRLVF